VYLGNGVSELIMMTMQALLSDGDEVLIPAPDYPLWTAATSLSGGTPVHYICDEQDVWNPSIEDIESKITERTKAIVVINPNNPTGAVYSREVLENIAAVARKHSLLVLADEIYDRILYDGAKHISMASLVPDLLCITYNGLSKAYRVAGYRAGWMVLTGPKSHAAGFIEGLDLMAGTRLCPNVPAQHAIQVALGGKQSIYDLTAESGRLHRQRDIAFEKLNEIPGVSVTKAQGALYAFPRLDPNVYEIHDDTKLMLDILRAEKILMVQGTALTGRPPTISVLSPSRGLRSWKKPLSVSATSWLVISSKVIGYILGGSPPPFPKLWVGIVINGSARFFLPACPSVFIALDPAIFRWGVRIVIVLRIMRPAQANGV